MTSKEKISRKEDKNSNKIKSVGFDTSLGKIFDEFEREQRRKDIMLIDGSGKSGILLVWKDYQSWNQLKQQILQKFQEMEKERDDAEEEQGNLMDSLNECELEYIDKIKKLKKKIKS